MEWCETGFLEHCFTEMGKRFFALVLVCILCAAVVYQGNFSNEISGTGQQKTEIAEDTENPIVSQEQMEQIRQIFADAAVTGAAVGTEAALINAEKLQETAGTVRPDSEIRPETGKADPVILPEVRPETVSSGTMQTVPQTIPAEETENPSAVFEDEKESAEEQVTPVLPDDPQKQQTGTAVNVIDGFLVDGSGAIYGVQDPEAVVTDGYMKLPSSGCSKIAAGAFLEGIPSVREIYIPSNITDIEEGAFTGLSNVEWYDVENGSSFSSCDGVLLSEDQTMILAFPAGRTGNYQVPSGVTAVGKDAFHDAKINVLDASSCILTGTEYVPDSIEILMKQES